MPRGIPNVKAETDKPVPTEAEPIDSGRRESFESTRPDGTVVVVDRNIDTGEQTVTEK